MKKILLYIAAFILGGAIFTSCEDLDTEPRDKYTEKNYWTSVSKAQLVLNMGYNQMYEANIMWRDEALSDNLAHSSGTTAERTIRRGEATSALGLFADEWKNAYGGIKTCHVFLANVNLVPNMNEALRNRMIDEIRFIRAYIYFRLVNYYGAVPFFTEELSLKDSYTVKRTDKNVIMKFIHDELDDIMSRGNIPTRENLSSSENGRITIGAVCAFQARAYLYENNYEQVKKYCEYLITNPSKYGKYELFTSATNPSQNYFRLFTPDNEYNKEVILDITYISEKKTWGQMGYMAPISKEARYSSSNPTQELVDSYMTMNGLPVKGTEKDPTYNEQNPYVNRDPRLTATVVYDNYQWLNKDGSIDVIKTRKDAGTKDAYVNATADPTKTGYYVRKYFDWNMVGNNLNSGLNIIMFRYADVLLMYAEATNELAKISQTDWDITIKAIRSRAGFTVPTALDYPSAKSQDQIKEIIRNERRVELAFEGLRWYDIKRWRIGEEVLKGYVHGFKFGGSDASVDNGYLRLDNRNFNNSRDYLWSVPLNQMDLNKNLKPNNPGY